MSEDGVSWIPEGEWETIVANVPLVSVDLVVRHEGGVVLGLRENEPAKGEWFVPGGTVLKNERLTETVGRVARTELGCEVEIRERLGSFEQFYDASEVEGIGSKHYLAHAFVVDPVRSDFEPDDQHSELRTFTPPFEGMHPYVARYLRLLEFE